MLHCHLTDKSAPLIFCQSTKSKLYFFDSFDGSFLCSKDPKSEYNASYPKKDSQMPLQIRHISGLTFLIMVENFFLTLNLQYDSYKFKHSAIFQRRFDSFSLAFAELPKTFENETYQILKNPGGDIFLACSNHILVFDQRMNGRNFFRPRNFRTTLANDFCNRELMSEA